MLLFRLGLEKDMMQITEMEQDIFTDPWTKDGIREALLHDQSLLVVAENAGEIYGYSIIYYVLEECDIVKFAVRQNARRLGVGSALMGKTVQCCEEKGIQRMCLEVRSSNLPAVNFYKQQGFLEDGVRKGFYQNPSDDALLMSRMLS